MEKDSFKFMYYYSQFNSELSLVYLLLIPTELSISSDASLLFGPVRVLTDNYEP
jgi:hypothetical protein